MKIIMPLVIVSITLGACDRFPGTDAYRTKATIKSAEESVAYDLIDPSSAQFRNIVLKRGTVCGQVNAKNQVGAYVGFKRFIAEPQKEGKWTARTDPQFEQDEADRIQEECHSAGNNPYSSRALVESACRSAIEAVVASVSQRAFDASWGASCK